MWKGSLSSVTNLWTRKRRVVPFGSSDVNLMETQLYDTMRPLLRSMQLVGLFHTGSLHDPETKQEYLWLLTQKAWGIAVCILFCFFTIKSFFPLYIILTRAGFGSELFLSTCYTFWYTLLLISAICSSSANSEVIGQFFKSWNEQKSDVLPCMTRLRRVVRIVTCIAWMAISFNTIAATYLNLAIPAMAWLFIYPVTTGPTDLRSDAVFYIAVAIMAPCAFLLSAAWELPIAYVVTICTAIRHMVSQFNEKLSAAIDKEGCLQENFEQLRREHCRVLKVIDCADNVVRYQIAAMLTSHIAVAVLMAYNIIWYRQTTQNVFTAMITGSWLLIGILIILILLIAGAWINSEASCVKYIGYNINLGCLDSLTANQVNTFINFVSTNEIGLTVAGMFTITKDTILTIMGVLVTYFVLIVQLRMPGDTAPGEMPCTCKNSTLTG